MSLQEKQNLIDRFMRENVALYPDTDVFYDSKEIDGERCATVGLEFYGGYALCQIVDRMRKDLGFKPLEPIDDEDYDDDCDQDGEYCFFVELNEYDKVEPCLTVMLINSESSDNEELYEIDLSDEEQEALYNRISDEAQAVLGVSIEDWLAESRKEMEQTDLQ